MIDKCSSLPLLAKSQIVVAGGGPSGFAAALTAARHGYKTLLVEQFGMLGGLATAGVVPMFAPASDGERMIYGGVFAEVNKKLCDEMGTKVEPECWQSIHPEIMKRILDDMALEAGIEVLFGVKICEAEVENRRIKALWAATRTGLKRIEGTQFVDATGDGLLAMLAGADFEYGDTDGKTMSPTLCAHFANIDYNKNEEAERQGITDRSQWRKLLENGTAPLPEHHFVCMKPVSPATANSNLGHIYGGNVLDERSLTHCYMEGRKIARVFEKFYRKYVPGFENAELISSAAFMGVRESRRILGEYRMTFQDYLNRADFEDEIGRCCYPVDIHSSTTNADEQKKVNTVIQQTTLHHGESYGIPYRSMIPQKLDNLLVPGRALSSDRAIQSSLRVMPPCFVTGQAAGLAAGLAGDGDVRNIDTQSLRASLRKAGAFFH